MLLRRVLLLAAIAVAELADVAFPFDIPPTPPHLGVFIVWKRGGVCQLPPGAGPRVYPSTPPDQPPGVPEGDGCKRVWYQALKRFKRVKVHGHDRSRRWWVEVDDHLLVAGAKGGGGVEE